ncbi:MAG: penicillin acylase family protein [Myxococcota bacterium]
MFVFLWGSGCALTRLAQLDRSHPTLDGVLEVDGASAELRIARDVYGVPHIRAASEADAWFGLGFAHAQDRLFQADLARHSAWGTLSSWFGADAVEFDAFARSLRLRDRAATALAAADPATRRMFEAYAAGINAGAGAARATPIEHRLLGVPFEPWTPEDGLAVTFLLSWALEDNLSFELAAFELAEHPPALLDALTRISPESPPIDPYWDELRGVDRGRWSAPFDAWLAVLGGGPDRAAASNNWVIGGSRSASGKPIVANDPHLDQAVPSLWYAADVAGGDLHVAGATIAGTPGVLIGHDARVAWGMTNVMADQVDLVVLERDGDGYRLEGQTHAFERVASAIEVRDGEPVQREVQFTAVGPVVNEGGEVVVAMRWATLEREDRLPTAVRALNRASTADEVLDATRALPLMVALNLVVADVDGGYGWRPIGSIVGRRAHTGRVPYPGSDPLHGWFGWLSNLPEERNPARGYVQTANSRPDHPLADAISTSYVPPWRFERIGERIEAEPSHTPASEHALQLDTRELLAARHRDRLLDGVTPGPDGARCHALLAGWDLDAGADSAGAAVWGVFLEQYVRHAIEDQLGAADTEVALSILSTARSPLDNGLFDAAFVEDRERSVVYALDRACAELEATLGPDPDGWTWGALHPLDLRHPFSARAPRLLRGWNLPPVPSPGSGATVAASSFEWGADDRSVTGMPSMRLVMPLDDLGASTFVHPGGQSGLPGHPGYSSHYVHFVTGQTLPLWFDDDDVAANVVDTLRLTVGNPPAAGWAARPPQGDPAAWQAHAAAEAERFDRAVAAEPSVQRLEVEAVGEVALVDRGRGLVYVGGDELLALDLHTGEVRWRVDAPGGVARAGRLLAVTHGLGPSEVTWVDPDAPEAARRCGRVVPAPPEANGVRLWVFDRGGAIHVAWQSSAVFPPSGVHDPRRDELRRAANACGVVAVAPDCTVTAAPLSAFELDPPRDMGQGVPPTPAMVCGSLDPHRQLPAVAASAVPPYRAKPGEPTVEVVETRTDGGCAVEVRRELTARGVDRSWTHPLGSITDAGGCPGPP